MTSTIIAVVAVFVAVASIIGWVLEHLAHTETKRQAYDSANRDSVRPAADDAKTSERTDRAFQAVLDSINELKFGAITKLVIRRAMVHGPTQGCCGVAFNRGVLSALTAFAGVIGGGPGRAMAFHVQQIERDVPERFRCEHDNSRGDK